MNILLRVFNSVHVSQYQFIRTAYYVNIKNIASSLCHTPCLYSKATSSVSPSVFIALYAFKFRMMTYEIVKYSEGSETTVQYLPKTQYVYF